MRTFLLIAVLFIMVTPLAAQEPSPKADDALLQELRKLNEKLGEVSVRLQKIEKQLAEQKDQAAQFPPGFPPNFQEQQRKQEEEYKQQHAELTKIQLPDNPKREDVEKYVREIINTSLKHSRMGSGDPQPEMLRKIGIAHVDLLLDNLGRGKTDWYVWQAMEKLVNGDHKQLVLSRLQKYPALVEIVVQMRWEKEAKPMLMEGLRKKPRSLPREWIDVVMGYADPDTYKLLTDYMAGCDNPRETYEAIRRLPEIDLDEAVADTWQRVRLDDKEKWRFAPIATSHGNLEALGFLMDNLDNRNGMIQAIAMGNPGERRPHRPFDFGNRAFDQMQALDPRNVVLKYIDFQGTNKDIQQWYTANKAHLQFDKKRKLFVVVPNAA